VSQPPALTCRARRRLQCALGGGSHQARIYAVATSASRYTPGESRASPSVRRSRDGRPASTQLLAGSGKPRETRSNSGAAWTGTSLVTDPPAKAGGFSVTRWERVQNSGQGYRLPPLTGCSGQLHERRHTFPASGPLLTSDGWCSGSTCPQKKSSAFKSSWCWRAKLRSRCWWWSGTIPSVPPNSRGRIQRYTMLGCRLTTPATARQ